MSEVLGAQPPTAESPARATVSPGPNFRPIFTGGYQKLWLLLLFGWLVSYADRTVTGPVVAWMIHSKGGFIGDSSHPAALGGLIGSMFFTGYMLTQYTGGRLGDRFGHREMLVPPCCGPAC
jgi:MFS family permease